MRISRGEKEAILVSFEDLALSCCTACLVVAEVVGFRSYAVVADGPHGVCCTTLSWQGRPVQSSSALQV